MLKSAWIAILLTAPALVSPAWQGSTQATRDGLTPPPIVLATEAPAGAETFDVQWFRVAVPDRGTVLAAVARPSGRGPFPVVVVLHGTHGFAPEYVQLTQDLARGGFLAVSGCWFSGAENPNNPRGARESTATASVHAVSPPIPCPTVPPLGAGAYEEGLQYIHGLVQAARALPNARPDRLALAGHSRGGAASLQYALAMGNIQALILHDAGHGLRPVRRAAEFKTPILILHGTNDGPAGGGNANTDVALARDFEATLRRNGKSVEAHYYQGGGHNTFFTNSTQRDIEVKKMINFLRRYLDK
jgi:carboxymethylenebutenolidase